jgi:hypothetical protein
MASSANAALPRETEVEQKLDKELKKLVETLLNKDPDVVARSLHALRHLAAPGVVSLVTLKLLKATKSRNLSRRRRADLALGLVLPLGMLPGPDMPKRMPTNRTPVPARA